MKLYWISVLVGFLAVVWLSWHMRNGGKETFTDTAGGATSATTGGATAGTAVGTTAGASGGTAADTIGASAPGAPYIEALAADAFPAMASLMVYLTSFSDKVRDASRGVYSPADAKWYNFMDSSMNFQLNSANGVPPSIQPDGMALKNMTLVGPSSAIFRDTASSVPYELPSFSVAWYAQGLQIGASEGNMPAMLWQMFGQSPSYMEVYIEGTAPPSAPAAPAAPSAPAAPAAAMAVAEGFTDAGVETYIDIKARIGDKVYKLNTAPVAASSLAAGGNPTLYAFVYKKCTNAGCSDGELTFYVGNTAYRTVMSPAPTIPIILANHNVKINSFGNIDVRLFAFCYFKTILSATDITKLGEYFLAEKNNYNRTMLALQAAQAAAATAAAGAADASASASQLEDELAQCRAAADDLRAKLEAGGAAAAKPWQIDAGGAAGVSTADMQMCSALEVRAMAARQQQGAAAPPAPPAAPSAPAVTPAPPAAGAGDWWKIPYTAAMQGVPAIAPDFSSLATAATTTTNATTTSANNTKDTILTGVYREAAAQAVGSNVSVSVEQDPITNFFKDLFSSSA